MPIVISFIQFQLFIYALPSKYLCSMSMKLFQRDCTQCCITKLAIKPTSISTSLLSFMIFQLSNPPECGYLFA